jgi:hypothetical protein
MPALIRSPHRLAGAPSGAPVRSGLGVPRARTSSRLVVVATALALAVLLLLVSVIAGLAAGTGSFRAVVVVGGLVFAAALLALSQQQLLLLLFFLSLLVVGTVGYLSQVESVYWVPYLIAGLMALKVAGLLVNRRQRGQAMPSALVLILLFWGVAAISMVINGTEPGTVIMAVKDYVLLWVPLFLIALALQHAHTIQQLWRLVLVAAVVQVPVCLYQYAIVGKRLIAAGKQGWDAVSGTLGGSESGGNSAALSFLVVVALVLVLAQWRRRVVGLRWLGAVAFAAVAVLALAEVKAAVVFFLPVGLLLLYRQAAVRNPLRFAAGAGGTMVLMMGFLLAYNTLHYGRSAVGAPQTASGVIVRAFELETQTSEKGMHSYDMGRTALLNFWVSQHNRIDDLPYILVGHGPASTRVSRLSVGEVAKRYPAYRLFKTSVSMLLWEVGVLGFGLFAGMLVISGVGSLRLSEHPAVPREHAALLDAGGVVLLLAAASLFHSRFVLDMPGMTLIVILCVGQAAFWARSTRQTAGSGTGHLLAPRARLRSAFGGSGRR